VTVEGCSVTVDVEEVEDIIIISWGVGGLTNVQVRLSIGGIT
jgi:hypothetical protein